MHTIKLDATGWRTALDFYDALLGALGAPTEHGRNINALTDSIFWGGMNAIEPPYTIWVRRVSGSPKQVIDEVEMAKRAVAEARAQYRAQRGHEVEVQLEITP